jgi:choline dehydrogenase
VAEHYDVIIIGGGSAGCVAAARLRVHGFSNLRVADASVMPVIPHAHTNNTSLMIGERLANFVKGDG